MTLYLILFIFMIALEVKLINKHTPQYIDGTFSKLNSSIIYVTFM